MEVAVVFFAIAIVFAAIGLLAKLNAERRARAMAGWPTAPALVTSVDIIEYSSGLTRYMPWITYSYAVGGKPYEGDRIRMGSRMMFSNRKEALAFLDRFPVQEYATVHYDPRRPTWAVLDGTPYSPVQIIGLVLAICMGLAGILAVAFAVLTH